MSATATNWNERIVTADEVAELRQALLAMREELDRRDTEQIELEGVIEFLLDRDSTHLLVLGAVVQHVLGDRPGQDGHELMNTLYRGRRHEAGFRQGQYVIWRRPERRWSQFGRKQDLVDLAAEHEVKVSQRDSRESIIRKLWSHRALHNKLPGCVGPFD